MKTLTALFDNFEDAAEAVRALEHSGIASDEISVLANRTGDGFDDVDDDNAAEGAGAGAGIGALLGGAGGLLAGLGAIVIPGLGPVIAGGWLAATAIGAVTGAALGGAAGGIIGSLVEAGVPEGDAHAYAEGVRRGGTLVTLRTDDAHADRADEILRGFRPVDMIERRRAYVESGWQQFDSAGDPYSRDEITELRGTGPGRVPPTV